MANETIILRAEFSEKVKTYWLMSTVVACVMSILGILALPILIPIIMVVGDRRLRANLHRRHQLASGYLSHAKFSQSAKGHHFRHSP